VQARCVASSRESAPSGRERCWEGLTATLASKIIAVFSWAGPSFLSAASRLAPPASSHLSRLVSQLSQSNEPFHPNTTAVLSVLISAGQYLLGLA
jgi:hypothetical protein